MRSFPVGLAVAASVLFFFGTAGARAELIQWTYSWSNSPTKVYADSPGTGYISLTDSNGLKSAAGDSYLVATNLQAHSSAGVDSPDVFTNKTYSLGLYLKDTDSSKSGTLTFTGEFNGTLTADSSKITNTFFGATTQSLVLGDHLYTVTIGPFDPPGPTGAVNSGSISARAEVSVSTIFHLPEPSSGVLAILGASGGLAFVRRRRRLP